MYKLMNSVYGFKDDEYDDEGGEVDEIVQKDHKALNRLKRDVGNLRRKLKTTLLI